MILGGDNFFFFYNKNDDSPKFKFVKPEFIFFKTVHFKGYNPLCDLLYA